MSALLQRARRSEFIRHGAIVFAGLMLANVLTYVYYALISRAVGVEAYGVFSSLFSVTLILSAPATMAATVVARLAADLRAVEDFGKLRRLGDIVTAVTFAAGVASVGIFLLARGPIAEYFHLSGTGPVMVTGLVLALALALPVQRGVFQGTQSFRAFALSSVIEAVTKAGAGPLLAHAFGATGALSALCLGYAASWLFNVGVLRYRYAPVPSRLRLDLRLFVRTASNAGVAVLAITALTFYDVVLVKHYFSAVDAGLYGASALVGRAVYTVVAFVPTVVLPKATFRAAAGASPVSLLAAAAATAGAIIGGALLVVVPFPQLVVTIVAGHAFTAAAGYVAAYTIALSFLSLANVTAMYKIGLHRFDFVAPLACVAVGEIVTVALRHRSIVDVLVTILIGHAVAFGTTLYRIHAPATRPRRAAAVQEFGP